MATIDDIISTAKLTEQAALVLHGRMQFAKALLWGRAAKLFLTAITAHAFGLDGGVPSDRTLAFLKTLREHLSRARPRLLTAASLAREGRVASWNRRGVGRLTW